MKDRFSEIAGGYAAFRPVYPAELYRFILGHLKNFDAAWDAGTGNGQVAADLAPHFSKVFATDISARQLEHAAKANNIYYSVAGETLHQPNHSIDLITVAQAIHWFDRGAFYREVTRVGKKDASLAVWGYGLLKIDTLLDPILRDFYTNIVGPYWDAERKFIDEGYATITFPFKEIKTPEFEIRVDWKPDDLIGYLRTWSSVRNYQRRHGIDPVTDLEERISEVWAEGEKGIVFPVFLRMGFV